MSLLHLALLFSVLTWSIAGSRILKAKLTVVGEDGEGTVISYPSGNRQRIEKPLNCRTICESCEPFGAQQFEHQQNYLLLGETCLGGFRYDIETGDLATLQPLSLDCPDMMCSCRPLYLVPSTQPGVNVLCHTGQYWRVPFQEATHEFSIDPLLEPTAVTNLGLMLRTGTIVAGDNPRNGGLRDYSVIITSTTLLLFSLGEPNPRGLTLPENLCDGDLLAVYPRQPSGGNPRVLLDCINDGRCERYEITINIDDFSVTSTDVPKIGTPLPVVIPGYVTFLTNTTLTIYRANYEEHGYFNFEAHIWRVFTLPDSNTPRLVVNVVNKNWFLIDIPTFVSTGGMGGVWELPNSVSSCPASGACVSPAIVVPDSAKYYTIFTMEQPDFTAHVYSLTDPSEPPLEIANINIRPSFAILHVLETGDPPQSIVEPTHTHPPQSDPLVSTIPLPTIPSETAVDPTSPQPTSIVPTSPSTTTEGMSTITLQPDLVPIDGVSPSSPSSKIGILIPISAGFGGLVLVLIIMIVAIPLFILYVRRRRRMRERFVPIAVSTTENPRPSTQGRTDPPPQAAAISIPLSNMHTPPQGNVHVSIQEATPTTEGGGQLAGPSPPLLHQRSFTPQPNHTVHPVPPRNACTPPPPRHFLIPGSFTPSDRSASSSLVPTPETSVSNLSDRLTPEGGEDDLEPPTGSTPHVQGPQRGQRALASQSRTDTVIGLFWPISNNQ